MPSWLRLRRARRYNVSSKNSYVVCVHLLDNTLIEATLNADSNGYECLENIAQRIELNEPEYFGLRYLNKKLQFRWLELDKCLKKQLDKQAHAPLLYFGVRFYVANAHRINDDMTRYQYYLQLKTDVIEGKLPCTAQQAVLLASYSVQAEFGDHDPDRHTADYLKDFVLLPRGMTTEEQTLATLTSDVSAGHRSLQGVPSHIAELQYIIEAQQLEGYGLEYYSAKDDAGEDLYIGSSFVGIVVRHVNNGTPITFHKWVDITNISYNKRTLSIQSSQQAKPVHFVMDSPEMAKYMHKMMTLQHTFYSSSDKALNEDPDRPAGIQASVPDGSIGQIPDIQQTVQTAVSQPDANGRIAGDSSNEVTSSQAAIQTNGGDVTSEDAPGMTASVMPADAVPDEPQYGNGSVYHMMAAETSPAPMVQQPASIGRGTPVLPAYRPTPDYESVMRQRMERLTHNPSLEMPLHANLSQAAVYTHPEAMAYSQPEIGYHQAYMGLYTGADGRELHYRPVDRSSSLIIAPTYSTPELTSQGLVMSSSEQRINHAFMAQFRPPPPYPRGNSSSTPDLASQTSRPYANSSPDLVSRKNLSNAGMVPRPGVMDRSVDNLAEGWGAEGMYREDSSSMHSDMPSLQPPYAPLQPSYTGLSDSSSIQPMLTGTSSIQPMLTGGSDNSMQPLLGHTDMALHPACRCPLNQDCPLHGPRLQVTSLFGTPNVHNHIYANTPVDTALLETSTLQPHVDISRLDISEPPPVPPTAANLALHNQTQYAQLNHMSERTFPPPPQYAPPLPTHQTSGASFRDTDSEVIDCLDISRIPSDHESSIAHSKTSSMDTSSLSSRPVSEISGQDVVGSLSMGPLKMAAMSGLSTSRGSVLEPHVTDDSRAPKDERRKMLENRLEEGQVFKEFEQIPRKSPTDTCDVAARQENKDRNRFKDVHPYDKNRVKLAATKTNPTGYINGSHIKVSVKGELWWYIATQGPVPDTVNDFWQMVWEQGVDVVAMLTGVQEFGRQKCQMYWPEDIGAKHKLKLGDYHVVLQFSNDSHCYVTRGLLVKHVPSKKTRLIWHLQYTDWPDHGCPEDVHGFLAYLDEIESVKRHVMMERKETKSSPVIVHCSAGVGRSGVVILSEIMKACLEHNVNADVPSMLCQLRCQRMHMVQTVSQYSFVYKTLVQYLKNSRLI